MTPIVSDEKLVSFCGLYCGACRSYLNGKCKGCVENQRATWCKVRSCCLEKRYGSCADCQQHADPAQCAKHNNFISKLIGLVLRSDRRAGVLRIREIGKAGFAKEMAESGRQAIRP